MSYQDQIINHYESVWNNTAKVYLWDKGPIEKLPHDFRILEFAPNRDRKMWSYSTCCMSREEDVNPIELHLFSSIKDESQIELLTTVSYYHRNTSRLGLAHTINFGRPWQKQSDCSYGFISLPYLDGPDLEDMVTERGKLIKFYWLIPVTEKEVEFKNKKGVEALENKFEENVFDYINPKRKSTV